MKKFAVSVLTISVFFVGLGSLAEQVGAKFKSDEKALEIVRKARTALGGDAALAEVRSMVITGRTVHMVKIGDAERQEPGETEIALQFPDKLSQRIKIGKDDGTGPRSISETHDVVIVKSGDEARIKLQGGENDEFTTSDGKKIVIREHVGGEEKVFTEGDKKVIVRKIENGEPMSGTVTFERKLDGKPGEEKHHTVFARAAHGAGVRQNELLRLSLSLLLTAPEGIEVSYTFAGESDIDGTPVNIINAEFAGSSYKLFVAKSNNLPVAVSYRGMSMPRIVKFTRGDAPAGEPAGDHVTFTRKLAPEGEAAEHIVKFSDYRSTGSVQLPYKWTTTFAGAVRETFDVTSYDLNPANIAERFANEKVLVRATKPVHK